MYALSSPGNDKIDRVRSLECIKDCVLVIVLYIRTKMPKNRQIFFSPVPGPCRGGVSG